MKSKVAYPKARGISAPSKKTDTACSVRRPPVPILGLVAIRVPAAGVVLPPLLEEGRGSVLDTGAVRVSRVESTVAHIASFYHSKYKCSSFLIPSGGIDLNRFPHRIHTGDL
jgi:hypothetical protein